MTIEIRQENPDFTTFFKLFGVLVILFFGVVTLLEEYFFVDYNVFSFIILVIILPIFLSISVSYSFRRSHMAIGNINEPDQFLEKLSKRIVQGSYYRNIDDPFLFIPEQKGINDFFENRTITLSILPKNIIISGPGKTILEIEEYLKFSEEFEEFR